MRPEANHALGFMAQRMMTHVAPNQQDDYTAADVAILSGLMVAMSQEYDRAADNRHRDIEEMRSIFFDALECLEEGELATSIQTLMQRQPKSLRVSDLNEVHSAFHEVLIKLHTRVEESDGDAWAIPLNRRIWRYYQQHTTRSAFAE